MIIFVFLLLFLTLYKVKPLTGHGFYQDYSSLEQTRSINGICIMLILFSHTFAKVSPNGVLDALYQLLRTFLGQFVVVPILFYSGYGIMESLSQKESYLNSFPVKRLLKIAIRFAMINVLYILMHVCLGNTYSPVYVLLSFAGITSIGNGGWYMLSTFVFYLSIILCFHIFKKNKILSTLFVALCLVALMVAEMLLDFPTYYYNTTIFFAVGMFYSLFKKKFDTIVMKNHMVWGSVLLLSVLGFAFFKRFMDVSVLFYPIWCGFGMLMLLCITMKVKIQNQYLSWLGKTIFFIFTLQGIPQIVFTKFITNNFLVYGLTTVTASLLAFCADYLFYLVENTRIKGKNN